MGYLQFLQYNQVFDKKSSVNTLMKQIPLEYLLNRLTHFNGYFKDKPRYNKNWFVFLNEYFSPPNYELKNRIIFKVLEINNPSHPFTIIYQLSVLSLIEDTLQLIQQRKFSTINRLKDFENSHYEVTLFKILLLRNQEFDNKQTRGYQIINKVYGSANLPKKILITTLPDYELNNRLEIDLYICQVLKASHLFNYLELNIPKELPKEEIVFLQKLRILYNKLLQYFEVEHYSDIFKHLVTLSNYVMERKEGYLGISIPHNENYYKICKFLDKFSGISVGTGSDFRRLRDKPLRKLKEGSYSIIHPTFILEKMYKSWYFKLNEINSTINSSDRINDFRGEWCKYFSEDYLLKEVISGAFPKESFQISGKDLLRKYSKQELKSEPDYYVRHEKNIYLFENKDTMLKAEVQTSYHILEIEAELEKKLKLKGISQLIGNIKKILSNTLFGECIENSSDYSVYPILVLHEDSFNAAGVNFLVNGWFKNELMTLQNEGFNISNIKSLAIITIDCLIWIHKTLRENNGNLFELLDEYFLNHLEKEGNQTSDLIPFIKFAQYKTGLNLNQKELLNRVQNLTKFGHQN